jgi:hypothetical protein
MHFAPDYGMMVADCGKWIAVPPFFSVRSKFEAFQ